MAEVGWRTSWFLLSESWFQPLESFPEHRKGSAGLGRGFREWSRWTRELKEFYKGLGSCVASWSISDSCDELDRLSKFAFA